MRLQPYIYIQDFPVMYRVGSVELIGSMMPQSAS
jgi:hypothetical protein